MAGPWEKYKQTPIKDGDFPVYGQKPWEKYQDPQPELKVAAEPAGEGLASKAGKFTGGAGLGVLEAYNPLNIPHGLESLARAPFQTVDPNKGFFERMNERFAKASDAAYMPNLRFERIGRDIRTTGRLAGQVIQAPFSSEVNLPTLNDFDKIQKEEQAIQDAVYNEPSVAAGRATGEIGAALYNLGSGAVQAGKNLPVLSKKASDALLKLRGLRSVDSAKTVGPLQGLAKEAMNVGEAAAQKFDVIEKPGTAFQQAQKLTKQLLGDVKPEIETAIFNRTQEVKKALEGGPEAQSLFKDVKALRSHIDGTKQMMGELVDGFKTIIQQDHKTQVNTRGAVQRISKAIKNAKLDTGESTLDSGDMQILAKYKAMFSNPQRVKDLIKAQIKAEGSFDEIVEQMNPAQKSAFFNSLLKDVPDDVVKNTNQRSVSDISKIIDMLDGDLTKFRNGTLKLNASRKAMAELADLRRDLKAGLHEYYPGYADADDLYHGYKNVAENIEGKINSMQGESFLAGIYGANKSEARQEFTNLISLGEKFSDRVKRMEIPEFIGDSKADDITAQILALKDKASKAEFKPAQAFLDDVANKIAARQLQSTKEGGLGDFPADKIQRLIDSHVAEKGKIGRTVGEWMGFTLGGGLGAGAGAVVGSGPGGIFGAGSGAYAGMKLLGGLGERVAQLKAERFAKQHFQPMKIFELLEKSKTASKESKKLAEDARLIGKVFGDDTLMKFLNSVPLSPRTQKDLIEISTKLSLGAKGLAGRVDDREGKK